MLFNFLIDKVLEQFLRMLCKYTEIKYKLSSEAYTEYRVTDNNIINIYDVVLLSKNKIKYIFQIYNTHKQNRNCNNWFEIDASELININTH